MKIFRHPYVRFGIAATIYLLWVIWIGNFWLLPGLAIVFDIYISKKVNWSFWKKREGKNSAFIEWLDALIFAVIAVSLINIFLFQNYRIPTGSMEKSLMIGDHLFVSKVAYGPRMPNTPIAFPFTQHTMPVIKTKSWSNLVQWPYKRLAGFGDVKNFDPIVFNFPAGDTVVLENQVQSYELIVRERAISMRDYDLMQGKQARTFNEYWKEAREAINRDFTVIYRPVDRRDNYVKRCIGIAGDSIAIRSGKVYVNGEPAPDIPGKQLNYIVETDGTKLTPRVFERLGISSADQAMWSNSVYLLKLTDENAERIRDFKNVIRVEPNLQAEGVYDFRIFPNNPAFPWNEDHFGPLWIPAKGSEIKLDSNSLTLYRRIIEVYEGNELKVLPDGEILINGSPADSYTFKMDYYWMMGDNRHSSADSRYWGFVPEDHIIGKPKFIWLSIDKEKSGLKKIRFNRMFHKAR